MNFQVGWCVGTPSRPLWLSLTGKLKATINITYSWIPLK